MIGSFNAGILIVAFTALEASALRGQNADSAEAKAHPAPPPAVFSIGQPPIWRQQLSAQGMAYGEGDRSGATFSYGVFHSFNKPPTQPFNPLLGLIGGTIEAYATIAGIEDLGLPAMATSRLLATGVGADWDIRHHRVNTIARRVRAAIAPPWSARALPSRSCSAQGSTAHSARSRRGALGKWCSIASSSR